MKRTVISKKNNLIKALVSGLVCTALISSQLFILGASVANGQSREKNNKYRNRINRIKSLGTKYRGAMKTLDTLSKKSIRSEENVREVVNALDQVKSTLIDGSYPSLVSVALSDREFQKSIESEVDKAGANNLLRMLKQNPDLALKFTNARSIQSDMKKQLADDAATYKALAETLKAAEEKFGDKTSVNNYIAPLSNSSSGHYRIARASFQYVPQYKPVSLLHSDSILENNNLRAKSEMTLRYAGIIAAVAAAAAVLIAAYAAAKAEDFNEDNDGVSDFKICTEKANTRLKDCLKAADNKSGFNKFIKRAGCWTRHGFDMNICLVLPL